MVRGHAKEQAQQKNAAKQAILVLVDLTGGGRVGVFFVLHELARAFFVSQPWPPAKDLWLGDNDDVYIMKTTGMFLSNPPRLKGQHEEGWLAIGCWKPQLFGIIFQKLLQMWFLRRKKLDWSSNALPVWCLRFGFVFLDMVKFREWSWRRIWIFDFEKKTLKHYDVHWWSSKLTYLWSVPQVCKRAQITRCPSVQMPK